MQNEAEKPAITRRSFLEGAGAVTGALIVEGGLAIDSLAQGVAAPGANFQTLQQAVSNPQVAVALERGTRTQVLAAARTLPEQRNVLTLPLEEQRRFFGNLVPPSRENPDVSKWYAVGFGVETIESALARKGSGAPSNYRHMNGIPVLVQGRPSLIIPASALTGTTGDDFDSIQTFFSDGRDTAIKQRPTGQDGKPSGIFRNAPMIRKGSFLPQAPDRTILTITGYSQTTDRKWNSAAQAGTAWNLAKFKALRGLIQEKIVAEASKNWKGDTLSKIIKEVIPKYLDQCYAVKVGMEGVLSPAGNFVGEVNSGGFVIAAGTQPNPLPVPFGIKSTRIEVEGIQFQLVHGPEVLRKMQFD